MGSAEPRSFSRGNRGIAGTLVFAVFDRDALLKAFEDDFKEKDIKIQKYRANDPRSMNIFTGEYENGTGFGSVNEWDELMTGLVNGTHAVTDDEGTANGPVGKYIPHYADEILPFDITLTFNKIMLIA